MFGNKVQRGLFGRKVEEIRDGWSKFHNGEQ
jgi:hypothetical protein